MSRDDFIAKELRQALDEPQELSSMQKYLALVENFRKGKYYLVLKLANEIIDDQDFDDSEVLNHVNKILSFLPPLENEQ